MKVFALLFLSCFAVTLMGHRRKCYVGKTIEEGIQERLSEVPERYYCIRGEMLITLLNVDVNIIAQCCRKSRITSPSAIKNLRSILNSLHRESGAFSVSKQGVPKCVIQS